MSQAEKYKLVRRLGEGSQGAVFLADVVGATEQVKLICFYSLGYIISFFASVDDSDAN